ncbi:ribosomal-processing cysteine protease Prp [Paenibacillus sp. FSL H8-0034]|uniref:ribosomal-processing cysteine protease Prp n=1 Tax=Paenibacillus sp. FSL H8-0034 TaxID=2954671 RepID=UPI0030FA43E6
MIRVKIKRKPDGRIYSFQVKGHAMYDEPGKDIVCAGVSAVTVGTVNSVEVLLGIQLKTKAKHGFLDVELTELADNVLNEKVQMLLESMVVMLQTIKQSYSTYIDVQENTK